MGCVNSNPKPGKPLPTTTNPPSGVNGPAVVGNNGAQSNISNPAGDIGMAAQQYPNLGQNPSEVRDSNQHNLYPHQSPNKLSQIQAHSINGSAMKGYDLPEVTQKTQQNQPPSFLNSNGQQHYESVYTANRKLGLDNDGFVPEDSVMDYGQSTIEDLNKVEVNFHV